MAVANNNDSGTVVTNPVTVLRWAVGIDPGNRFLHKLAGRLTGEENLDHGDDAVAIIYDLAADIEALHIASGKSGLRLRSPIFRGDLLVRSRTDKFGEILINEIEGNIARNFEVDLERRFKPVEIHRIEKACELLKKVADELLMVTDSTGPIYNELVRHIELTLLPRLERSIEVKYCLAGASLLHSTSGHLLQVGMSLELTGKADLARLLVTVVTTLLGLIPGYSETAAALALTGVVVEENLRSIVGGVAQLPNPNLKNRNEAG